MKAPVTKARRSRIDLMSPAELFIRAAVGAVEDMPADVRLTTAQTLLMDAQRLVADYIDGVERGVVTMSMKVDDTGGLSVTGQSLADGTQSKLYAGAAIQPIVLVSPSEDPAVIGYSLVSPADERRGLPESSRYAGASTFDLGALQALRRETSAQEERDDLKRRERNRPGLVVDGVEVRTPD